MDFGLTQYILHLGQGTSIDSLSYIVSTKTFLFFLWFVVMGIVVLKNKNKRKLLLLTFFVSGILFYLIGEIGFKHMLVQVRGLRLRPYLAYPGLIHPIGQLYADTSFPSNHMLNVVTLFTVALYFFRRLWPIALLMAFVMGFSRIHNGMHYPSDILAGSLLGIFCGILSIAIGKYIFTQQLK